uniref:Uncharacterized protein n=1 Tax=Rhizophora mucronata TaxID=61149 RepID=A0A2P2J019_RHIMU
MVHALACICFLLCYFGLMYNAFVFPVIKTQWFCIQSTSTVATNAVLLIFLMRPTILC